MQTGVKYQAAQSVLHDVSAFFTYILDVYKKNMKSNAPCPSSEYM